MGPNIGITDLFFAYILFTGFCLMLSIAFVYARRRILFCILSAVLLAGLWFLCRMLVSTEAVSSLFYILGLFYFIYLCSFFLSYLLCCNRRRGVLQSMSLSGFFPLFIIAFIVLLALTEGDGLDGFELPDSAPQMRGAKQSGRYPWL